MLRFYSFLSRLYMGFLVDAAAALPNLWFLCSGGATSPWLGSTLMEIWPLILLIFLSQCFSWSMHFKRRSNLSLQCEHAYAYLYGFLFSKCFPSSNYVTVPTCIILVIRTVSLIFYVYAVYAVICEDASFCVWLF